MEEGISPLSLGNLIVECLNNCRIGDYDFSENSFKDFLKLTKLRSQKDLDRESIRVQVLFDTNRIEIIRFHYDSYISALVSDEENRVVHDRDISCEELVGQ